MSERDQAAERLARIDVLLQEAKDTVTQIARAEVADPTIVRRLTTQLDQMLKEWRGIDPKAPPVRPLH